MYTAYFFNTKTGELKKTSQPSDNPKGTDWQQIAEEEYKKYLLIAKFYVALVQ
jgi:hypothetical protein